MSISEPSKFLTPWAESGLKNPIPADANPVTGRAGFDQGFPAINMTPKESGGIPPFGQDFNGIFFDITTALRYMQSGGRPTFSSSLAAAIGGYPKGAVVMGDDGVATFQNSINSNASNPNSGGIGWIRIDPYALTQQSGFLTPEAGWEDVPSYSDPNFGNALNAQAGALAARSEFLRIEIQKAKQELKTSDYASLSAALDAAISLGADVLIDNAHNITSVITKSLIGRDITISSTPAGWVNFTPSSPTTYYQAITLTGTGVESVHTDIKLDGGKVRGVGSAIVGVVVNNVHLHHDSSEMRNVSACVSTVKADFHICHGANYYNVHQQLASQAEFAGVYGYGTVPIDCGAVIVFGNEFGMPGAPIDRHAVYASSYDDGTGYCVNAFVYDNAVVMRNYLTEDPETTFERAFKFIGTKRVHVHDNELDGGYGLALITLRKHQTMDFVGISDNRGRSFAEGVTITSQDATADEPDATWQLADLKLGDNDLRFQTTTSGLSVGVRYRNVSRIQDRDSRYYNEAYATTNALSVYVASTDRIRATFLDSQGCQYDKFQNVFRGEEPTSLYIDIAAMHPDSTNSPLAPTVTATNRNLRVRSIDNTAAWKSGFLSSQVQGFSYYDAAFGRYITSAGAGVWVDDRGFQVVGLSSARPNSVPVGHIFYQTDGSNYIRWTGSAWILTTAPWSGIITFGTTAQINAVTKSQLGYGHMIYNTDTKKPAFFDALAQAWKYADGTAM